MDARALTAGDVAVLPLPDGSWAACLVTAADNDGVSVCALDWQSAHPPTVAELAGTPPLRLDHHLFTGRWAHHTVPATEAVPPSLDWIGRMPVPGPVRDTPNSYASWTVLTYDVLGQRRWNRLDPAVRAAYRTVTSGPGPVELSFGAAPVTLDPRRTTQLDLSDGSIPLPATGDPSWPALDRLGRCTALTWRGADRGLTAALAARPLVTRLTWIDPPAEVDLSGTAVTDLTLRGCLPVELRLPPGCHGLALEPEPSGRDPHTKITSGRGPRGVSAVVAGQGAVSAVVAGQGVVSAGAAGRESCGVSAVVAGRESCGVSAVVAGQGAVSAGAAGRGSCAVIADAGGRWLSLRLTVTDAEPVPLIPDGVAAVREVRVFAAGIASIASLAPLAELEQLMIHFRKPPGRLAGADALAGHARLTVVTIDDAYALEAGTLPDLPALTHLEIDGVRRSVATELRRRHRRTGTRLVLSGAKTDLWLAANLDNPLRDWVDDDTRGGAAACKAYADALRAITKLPPDGPERREQAIRALHTMITRLNAIDARLEMIDTVRREEACAAFADLAGRAGIPPAEADDLCDTWRDW